MRDYRLVLAEKISTLPFCGKHVDICCYASCKRRRFRRIWVTFTSLHRRETVYVRIRALVVEW